MGFKSAYFILLLIGLAASAPKPEENKEDDDKIELSESMVVYTSEHDIVQIVFPLNRVNIEELTTSSAEDTSKDDNITIFFVEADLQDDGEKVYKGISSLRNKKSKKVLDNGVAITADNKDVYFGATDGLYIYNAQKKEAEKYGSLTDKVIDVAKAQNMDLLYMLTEDRTLYSVREKGTVKAKMDLVADAREIILDSSNHLYFLCKNKKPHVIIDDTVKEIVGLPEAKSYVTLVKPPFEVDDGVVILIDDNAFTIYANGTTEPQRDLDVTVKKPTALGMEASIVVYIGNDKKIYEYNVITASFSKVLDDLKETLDEFTKLIDNSLDAIDGQSAPAGAI